MRVWPPSRDIRNAQHPLPGRCPIGPGELCARPGTSENRKRFGRYAFQIQRDRQHAIGLLQLRAQIDIAGRDRPLLDQEDLAIRANDLYRWAPAGHMTDQRGTQEPQPRLLDHHRLPACPWALRFRQHAAEAPEGDMHPMPAIEDDVGLVRLEHRATGQDVPVVEEDLSECREPLEAQLARAVSTDLDPVPDVLVVQRLRLVETPLTKGPQRACGGPRDDGG